VSDTEPLFGVESYRSAVLSPCGTYRYELTRRWSPRPLVGWVLLNPSTADADTDDPTVRRCIGFARAWGYGGIVIRNLFALRATDPSELDRHSAPVGSDNDTYLARCSGDDVTVLAWGARGGSRGRDVLELLARQGVQPYQLAVTADGQPRHPLYLTADLEPTPVPNTQGDER
jgi:hypothetical protein